MDAGSTRHDDVERACCPIRHSGLDPESMHLTWLMASVKTRMRIMKTELSP
jgi:hypothetical protein